MHVRPATAADAAAVLAIYDPIVRTTPISFEEEPPTVAEMGRRIEEALAFYVCEDEGIAGYAYAGRFNPRAAYRWSVELSVYVGADRRGRGVGRALLERLIHDLTARGFVTAFAGVNLPNDASVNLFESYGFRRVALYRNVGYKLGAWRDVAWWQRALRDPPAQPQEPKPVG